MAHEINSGHVEDQPWASAVSNCRACGQQFVQAFVRDDAVESESHSFLIFLDFGDSQHSLTPVVSLSTQGLCQRVKSLKSCWFQFLLGIRWRYFIATFHNGCEISRAGLSRSCKPMNTVNRPAEDERLEGSELLRILSTSPTKDFDNLALLAAHIRDPPIPLTVCCI